MSLYNFNSLVITKLSYYFSYFFTVLPVNHFSPILRSEDNMVPTQPFRMCQILFFRHKKTPFRCGREPEQLRLIEKVFFLCITVLGSTRLAGGFLFRSLPLPQLPEGLNQKAASDSFRRRLFFCPETGTKEQCPGTIPAFCGSSRRAYLRDSAPAARAECFAHGRLPHRKEGSSDTCAAPFPCRKRLPRGSRAQNSHTRP